VAVLAVDEGILQVARYRNPDPLGYFFRKRMLEVESTQILDLILPEFKQFAALAAPGGDADGGFARHLNPFSRKRKPPVAYWSGVIDVPASGRNLRYTVPDYFNGRLRVVAVAVSARRVAVAESGIEVKGDVILTPNVPAMVAPGDEFIVSVGIFDNTSGNSRPIQIEALLGPELAAQGDTRLELIVPDKKEGVAEFRLKANDVLGPTPLTFVARRGAYEARIEESISVRPLSAYRTQLSLGRLENTTAVAPLTRELYSRHRNVEAAVSFVPLVWGRGLVAYLDEYPYPCTEQLVSQGMGALVVLSRPEFGTVRGGAEAFAKALERLQSRENAEGGFGLWASSWAVAEFPTVYAAHLLVEAKERGQKFPAEMLASVNEWLTRFAASPAGTLADARVRAYAVYLLARQGIQPNAALANVEQELTRRHTQAWASDLAAAYLAATYRLMQRNNDAERIVAGVPWAQQKREWGDDLYYGDLVHDAQLLYLLARHFPARLGRSAPPAFDAMASSISGNRGSSLSIAYTVLALDAYATAAATAGKLGIAEIAKDGSGRALTLPTGAMPKAAVAETAAKVQFTKDGPAPAFYVVNESGFDRNPPVKQLSEGIEVFREFLDLEGNALARLTVGEEFLVRLRLRAGKADRLPQIAVVDLLPGGVEPVLELQSSSPASIGLRDKSTWKPEHVDVRDDRVVLYGEATKAAAAFVYRVRATNAGLFQAPPAFAEGMYNRTIAGLSGSGRLEIVKP
jgi:uncharacterized protein YfaS (alpha-2-macroglobulin family)